MSSGRSRLLPLLLGAAYFFLLLKPVLAAASLLPHSRIESSAEEGSRGDAGLPEDAQSDGCGDDVEEAVLLHRAPNLPAPILPAFPSRFLRPSGVHPPAPEPPPNKRR
jgi:hypothetical protein